MARILALIGLSIALSVFVTFIAYRFVGHAHVETPEIPVEPVPEV